LKEATDPGGKRSQPEPPKPRPLTPEDKASTKLYLAKLLDKGGKTAIATVRYKEIMDQFPETKAAKEARELLKKRGE
jgi:TolA-binding protein